TIDATTGVATGIVAGTTTITYTIGTGCMTSSVLTVNPLPANVTGPMQVCAGLTTTLSDATPGGAWSSGSPSLATVSAGGVVTGVSAGAATISYTLPTGCTKTAIVTVNPLPAPITGTMTVCENATTTLSDASAGGVWSTAGANASVSAGTGVVTGNIAGT